MSSAVSPKASLFNRPQLGRPYAGSAQESADANGRRTSVRPQRSDRVCIGITVQVSGTDLNGQDFLERTQTEHISRNGAALVLNRFLGPDQHLTIRRAGSHGETTVRVVGQVGIRSHGYVYGIALAGDDNFWGVQFPSTSSDTVPVSLRCSCCASPEQADLNEIERSVLEANGVLSRNCSKCRAVTFWQVLQHGEADQDIASQSSLAASEKPGKPSRRKNLRTSMRASACICQPTGLRDVASVLDISRGGFAFRTSKSYTVHSWIELAVPYTEGGANIFVAGRIVWERQASPGSREYGVQYVKN
jgi:PilZ domain